MSKRMTLQTLEGIALALGCHDEFVGTLQGKTEQQIMQEKADYMFRPESEEA